MLGVLLPNKNEKEIHDVTIVGTHFKIKASGVLAWLLYQYFLRRVTIEGSAEFRAWELSVITFACVPDLQRSLLLYTLISSTSMSTSVQ